MTALTVNPGWIRDGQREWTLQPGESLAFGHDDQLAELVIPDEHTAPVVGRVMAGDGHWTIHTVTMDIPVLVENVSGNDFVSAPAGIEMPVPFAAARVLVFGSTGIFAIAVRAAVPLPRASILDLVSTGGGTSPLNHEAKYFGVLVALCEPALRYGPMTPLPTSAEIVQRLRRLPEYRSITKVAVDFHLNYLCTQKLRGYVDAYLSIVGAPAPVVARSRRTALVQLVLRFNLVRRQNLRMLDGGARAPRPLARPPAPRAPG